MIEAKFQKKIGKLCWNNGGEYLSDFCDSKSITLQYTITRNPQHGVAERLN